MNHSMVMLFVSLTACVLMASAQLPTTWTNPYFFYHYNIPLAPTLPETTNEMMYNNQKQSSVYDVQSLPTTLESHVSLMSTCVRELKTTKADLAQTTQRLDETYTVVEVMKQELENLKKVVNERTSDIVDIGKMPTSCADLRRIGNKKNGFFSIMRQNKIQAVHCNFTKQQTEQNYQSLIGYVDVKTSPVYFHAQKTSNYANVGTTIPFEMFKLNVGNAINSTGVFVAPKQGTYFFSFSGLSFSNAVGRVDLQMKNATADWFKIGQAFGQQNFETLTLQSTVQLAGGDQIRLVLREGIIHEATDVASSMWTHFVGLLLEEDII